jgi:WD40 repeat protein
MRLLRFAFAWVR